MNNILLIDESIEDLKKKICRQGGTDEIDCHPYVKRARAYENNRGSPYEWREQAAQALKWGNVKELKV